MIEVLLSCRAAGAVHGMEDLVHVQVVPCDIVDPEASGVVAGILRNLSIPLGTCLLGGWFSEVFAQSMKKPAAGAPSLPDTQHEGDQNEKTKHAYEDQSCPQIFHKQKYSNETGFTVLKRPVKQQ